jgi:hypothetical protein
MEIGLDYIYYSEPLGDYMEMLLYFCDFHPKLPVVRAKKHSRWNVWAINFDCNQNVLSALTVISVILVDFECCFSVKKNILVIRDVISRKL